MCFRKYIQGALVVSFIFLLTGCSFFSKSCYNKTVNSENYTEVDSVQKIKFEIINNDSSSFSEAITSYADINPGVDIDVEDYNCQLQILDNVYVSGAVAKSRDGYVLLDRDTYMVFVKYFNDNIPNEDISDIENLMKVANKKTNNYFDFTPTEEKKTEFCSQLTKDNVSKAIGTYHSTVPFLKNTTLTGYVAVICDGNKNSAIMVVMTDKAFNSSSKKEMLYMAKSLVFDENSKGKAEGILEFTDKNFSIIKDSKNILFDYTPPAKQNNEAENTQIALDGYKYIAYSEIARDGNTYWVLDLVKGDKRTDEGFISTTMDNLTFSTTVYSNDQHVDISFVEDRILKRTNTFLSTLKASPSVYSNIECSGVLVSNNSAYSIITYDLKKDKEAYSCIEIYKEDIQDDAVVSYDISYRPLTPAPNDSKVAYNEIMSAIGLRK